MDKSILIGFISVLTIINCEARKIPGEIITKEDTLHVTFEIPISSGEINYGNLQRRVKYTDSEGVKTTLKPNQVVELHFNFKGEAIRMISAPIKFADNILLDSAFLKLAVDGNLKLYHYYYRTTDNSGFTTAFGITVGPDKYQIISILQKPQGELKVPNGMRFRADMTTYFSDCPALVEMIEEKYFNQKDIFLIVTYYNKSCG